MSALRKVLVVDDDAVVGKSFDRVLSHDKGYLVITAQNAAEALEKLREQEFDVVFTDIRMPGMDGIDLAEQVRAKKPWTPVVIITGYGTESNEVRAKAVGVSGFVRKPLSPEMIEESARHALLKPMPWVPSTPDTVPVQAVEPEWVAKANNLKKFALLLAAPFIGLAYALLLPLVGMTMLAWVGGKALIQSAAAKRVLVVSKNVALFFAAPFIGLAYAVMLPFVGTAMLVWVGVKALRAKPHAK